MEMGGGTEEEDDARREDALAAAPLLQSGFKSSKVSQSQLDKFRELHNRRLQIKEGSKDRRKSRGNANGNAKGQKKEVDVKVCKEKDTTALPEDSNIPMAKGKSHLSPMQLSTEEDQAQSHPSAAAVDLLCQLVSGKRRLLRPCIITDLTTLSVAYYDQQHNSLSLSSKT
ncbi:hypothetical protein Taro_006708 [Colocasia esculenta]|uniref:Uncharacterized protein n=1 Tax=Colocasia esculenta TaxID=4460 RepID=A0A843TY71_COLES|nr:hypothetical protein [Colocasia esculenta]